MANPASGSITHRINEWGRKNPWQFAVIGGWVMFVLFVPLKLAAAERGVFDVIYESGTFAFFWTTINGLVFTWRFRNLRTDT